jgi:prepilin-type N-terminal cleavage/methylation domain-containing protein
MRGVVRPSAGGLSHGAGAAASRGLTILELLIAIVIFAVALLTLAATLLSDLGGIRREGQITTANQVAVTVLEDVRGEIRRDNGAVRIFDVPLSQPRSVQLDGATYTGTLVIEPLRIAPDDSLIAPGIVTPHVYRVSFSIPTEGVERLYQTLVVRNP